MSSVERALVPFIKLYNTLLVPIQIELDDTSVELLQEQLLERIRDRDIEAVIIDVSAIELIDSFIARALVDTAEMAHLMGVKTILIGMRPEIALTLSQMGMKVDIMTAVNLERALELLNIKVVKE